MNKYIWNIWNKLISFYWDIIYYPQFTSVIAFPLLFCKIESLDWKELLLWYMRVLKLTGMRSLNAHGKSRSNWGFQRGSYFVRDNCVIGGDAMSVTPNCKIFSGFGSLGVLQFDGALMTAVQVKYRAREIFENLCQLTQPIIHLSYSLLI